MSRVHIIDGQLCFSLELTYEMAIISRGPAEAWKAMHDAAQRVDDEKARLAMLEVADTSILIPATREDKYKRINAFCRELGEAIGEGVGGGVEIIYPLCKAFQDGFIAVGEIETLQSEGAKGLCFRSGKMTGELVASLFSEEDSPDFQTSDFENILKSFLSGILGEQEQE
jgi:hypothetical protein